MGITGTTLWVVGASKMKKSSQRKEISFNLNGPGISLRHRFLIFQELVWRFGEKMGFNNFTHHFLCHRLGSKFGNSLYRLCPGFFIRII